MIKVSVYCTVFNHEKYLRSALEGFVNQITDFEFEVIVHDDASTDGSADIIREYEIKYPNIIKGIYQKNNLYSKGVLIFEDIIRPLMKGEYIASCEGDDYWTDNYKLQKQVDFLDSHPEYIACVHNTIIKNLWKNTSAPMYSITESKDIGLADVIGGGSRCYQTSSLMYRSSFYNYKISNLCRDVRSFGDYQRSIYLALCGKIHYLKDVMSVYRYGTNGSFTVRIGRDIKKQIQVYKDMLEILEKTNKLTDYEYESIFREAIVNIRYLIYQDEGKYSLLKNNEFKKIYMGKTWFYRLSINILDFLGPISPYIISLRRKFKYRNI